MLSDRTNTLIARRLIFPIYSVLASRFTESTACSSMSRLIVPVCGRRATWAMHMSFNWIIPKGQPDLHYGGTFFSVMIIYLLNLALLAALLIIASPQLTWQGFASELLQEAVDSTHWVTLKLAQLW